MGSVFCVWGEPGDPLVEFLHLKQPAEDVGPLELIHDHTHGRTIIEGGTSALEILQEHHRTGIEVRTLAERLYKNPAPTRSDIERARRKLESMAARNQAIRDVNSNGTTIYRPA